MTRKGQRHDICGAICADGINICRRPPGSGTDHKGFGNCSQHGGSTRNGYKKAAIREARSRGQEFGRNMQIVDPADALREELSRTHALAAWARDKAQEIIDHSEQNAKLHESNRDPAVPLPRDIINDPRFTGYKLILDDERDRLVRIARATMDASLQSRKQALAEALAAVVIDCFHAMTRQIPDLTPSQLTAAQAAIRNELTTATERLLLNP